MDGFVGGRWMVFSGWYMNVFFFSEWYMDGMWMGYGCFFFLDGIWMLGGW
jgi:hypothetical protein